MKKHVNDMINRNESITNIINYMFVCDCSAVQIVKQLVNEFNYDEIEIREILKNEFNVEFSQFVTISEFENETINYKDMEIEIFVNGCTIECEFITSENKRIRLVKTVDNHEYKMIYRRNEHYIFVIENIIKIN